jgi:hypothetical protein
MVVRVSVVDTDAAAGLMQRVRCEVTVAQVEFDPARQEVCIEIEKQPDETLVEVLNLLENWLGAGRRPPTSVEIDDHRYLLGAVG